jgi:hypothetical protein
MVVTDSSANADQVVEVVEQVQLVEMLSNKVLFLVKVLLEEMELQVQLRHHLLARAGGGGGGGGDAGAGTWWNWWWRSWRWIQVIQWSYSRNN